MPPKVDISVPQCSMEETVFYYSLHNLLDTIKGVCGPIQVFTDILACENESEACFIMQQHLQLLARKAHKNDVASKKSSAYVSTPSVDTNKHTGTYMDDSWGSIINTYVDDTHPNHEESIDMVKSIFFNPFAEDHMENVFHFTLHEFKRLYVHYATYYEPLLAISCRALNNTQSFDKFTTAFEETVQVYNDILEESTSRDGNIPSPSRLIKYINRIKLIESYPFDVVDESTRAAFRSFAKAPKNSALSRTQFFRVARNHQETAGHCLQPAF